MTQVVRMPASPSLDFKDFAATMLTQSVILVDDTQSVIWANSVALRLHGVGRLDRLGANVAEYLANFRVEFDDPAEASARWCVVSATGLRGGALRMVRPCDGKLPVHGRMQLFRITDATTRACSTAMILRLDEAWQEAGPAQDESWSVATQDRAAVQSRASEPPRPSCIVWRNPAGRGASEDSAASRREAAASARLVCAAVPIALHVLDAEMRVLCVSDAWLSWLGYTPASVTDRDIGLFMDAETRIDFEQKVMARNQDARHGVMSEETIRCRFLKQSGKAVDALVAVSLHHDQAGALACVTCAPVEITDHQRDGGLTRLMTQSPTPIVCWQFEDLTVREANQALYALTGHPQDTLVGQNFDNLGLCETKAARQKLEVELRASGVVQRHDVRVRTAGGEMLTCAVTAAAVTLSGHSCGVLMLHDVAERRRDEGQLFEAIEAVMKDSAWFSRTVIEKLAVLRAPPKKFGRHAELSELTRREREVLTLISVGQCDLEIARQLGLTRSTVRNHVATLYSKIDVHSRSSAIVWARERGINLTMSRPITHDHARAAAL